MRLRNVPGAGDRILEDPYTIQTDGADSTDYQGKWLSEHFPARCRHGQFPTQGLQLEIGMGKGKFLLEMAGMHPELCFIGIEKYSSVLVRALDARQKLETDNLLFLRMDAEVIDQYFAPGEVDRIYLNFSDPWPKDRHARRRLTSIDYLRRYEHFLTPDGELQFKTDNRPLFDFSLEQLKLAGWRLESCTYDLHANGPAPDNIMTEYEEKFYQAGKPICKLIARQAAIADTRGYKDE